MKKNYRSILILVTLCCLLLYALVNTNQFVIQILDYTEMFIKRLFPVSFIFFVISNLLMDYQLIQLIQKTLKIKSPYFYFFFISLISGFPAGAVLIKEGLSRKIIDEVDANRIIMFAHFPNPLFVLNSVYIVTGSYKYTLAILLSIIISNFIIFIFVYRKNNLDIINIEFPSDFSLCLLNSVNKAIKVLITIYGTSLFFYLLSYIISGYISNNYLYVLCSGIFDLTKGVYNSSIISNVFIRSIFILGFISFGPLSIHLQIKSIISDTSVSYKKYVIGRIIATTLSILMLITYCSCWN